MFSYGVLTVRECVSTHLTPRSERGEGTRRMRAIVPLVFVLTQPRRGRDQYDSGRTLATPTKGYGSPAHELSPSTHKVGDAAPCGPAWSFYVSVPEY